MANNTFNNVAEITKSAMKVFENQLAIAKYVNRQYDDQFKDDGAKQGDTANIRLPGFYKLRQGKVAQPNGYNDAFVPVTLNQFGVDVQFSTKELLLNVDDFEMNVLAPMIAPVANQVDSILAALIPQFYQTAGTFATPPTDFQAFLDGAATLDESAITRDGLWTAVMNPRTQAKVVGGMKGLLNPITDISRQYKEGTMEGMIGGMKWTMDQNLPVQTCGPLGGSPTVKTASVDGDTTLATQAWTAAAAARLNVGDVFTVANVYKVNPQSKQITNQLQNFVVTSAFSSDGSGNGSVSISPAIWSTGPLQNVNSLPQVSAALTITGTANALSNINAVFHRDALLLASADLPKPPGVECSRVKSKRLNMSMRLVKFYNGSQDDILYRLDVLAGAALLRGTAGVKVYG